MPPRTRLRPSPEQERVPFCPEEDCGRLLYPVPGQPGALECSRCHKQTPDKPELYGVRGHGGRPYIGGELAGGVKLGERNLARLEARARHAETNRLALLRMILEQSLDQLDHAEEVTWGQDHLDVALELLASPTGTVARAELTENLGVDVADQALADFQARLLAQTDHGQNPTLTDRRGLQLLADALETRLHGGSDA